MKKILVAFDGSRYSESALNYALKLSNPGSDLIVGLFIEDLSYAYMFSNFGVDPMGHELSSGYGPYIDEVRAREAADIEQNKKAFMDRCEESGARYTTHLGEGGTAKRLVEESVFADLLITGYQVYFSNMGETDEQKVLKDVLAETNCPVLVVPEEDRPVEDIIFTYDGGEEAVYAIKQFTYLLSPSVGDLHYELLSIQPDASASLPNESLVREYLHQHYPDINYEIKEGDKPEEALTQHMGERPHAVLVMGSFGRNAVSRFFSASKASGLLESKSTPVFIAHR